VILGVHPSVYGETVPTRGDGMRWLIGGSAGGLRRGRLAPLLAAAILTVGLVVVGRGGLPPVAPGPVPSVGPATTAPPTTRHPPAKGGLVLGARGLGPAAFGQPADQVIAALRAGLGEPDEDRRWDQRKRQRFGVCPGSNHRFVRWGRLSVLFADGDTGRGHAGRQHLFAWYAQAAKARGKRLATVAGVAVGSSTAQVRAAYGDRATVWGAEGARPAGFRIGSPQAFELLGWLTHPSPRGRVTMLAAGTPCGE
jgi:hypothetical protein